MKMGKQHKIAIVILIIAAFLVVENTLLRPTTVFRYTGIQIYDSIRDYNNLEDKGFDIVVNVQGTSDDERVELSGRVVEKYAGWFVMRTGNRYRIIEGPMGSKDVLSDLIYFNVSPRISVEAIFPPQKGEFSFQEGYDKIRGSIAFDNAEIEPTLVQELRNMNEEFYSLTPGRIDVATFGSGVIIDIKVPVDVEDLAAFMGSIDASEAQTGYMYYYTGVEDEDDIGDVKRQMESDGAVLVNYYKQR
jgi:hypothetical protein